MHNYEQLSCCFVIWSGGLIIRAGREGRNLFRESKMLFCKQSVSFFVCQSKYSIKRKLSFKHTTYRNRRFSVLVVGVRTCSSWNVLFWRVVRRWVEYFSRSDRRPIAKRSASFVRRTSRRVYSVFFRHSMEQIDLPNFHALLVDPRHRFGRFISEKNLFSSLLSAFFYLE